MKSRDKWRIDIMIWFVTHNWAKTKSTTGPVQEPRLQEVGTRVRVYGVSDVSVFYPAHTYMQTIGYSVLPYMQTIGYMCVW